MRLMRLLIHVIGIALVILCTTGGCGSSDGGAASSRNRNHDHRGGSGPLPDVGGAAVMLQTASYEFVTADDEGHPLVRGRFTLPWPITEGQVVRGSWESRYVGPRSTTQPESERQAVGPQLGRGTLTAERDGDEVRINLNPNMADNNVTLVGTINADALVGRWDYSTFVGSTAGGPFEARQVSSP